MYILIIYSSILIGMSRSSTPSPISISPPKKSRCIDAPNRSKNAMDEEVRVLFTRVHPDAKAPIQGSSLAAGWDLKTVETCVINKGKTTKDKQQKEFYYIFLQY